MALTKVRPPVTEISELANGTTTVGIPNPGGDIDVNVSGADVIDIGQTSITLDDLVQLVTRNILGELIALQTVSGAGGRIRTQLADMEVGTTTLHPLHLIVNGIPGLTLQTDGRATLNTVGSNPSDLVDKDYVDTLVGGVGGALTSADFTANLAVRGHIVIPNSTANDLIINWGQTPPLNNTTYIDTYDIPFPNAFLVGFATRVVGSASREAAAHFASSTLTQPRLVQSGGGATSPVNWLALGY